MSKRQTHYVVYKSTVPQLTQILSVLSQLIIPWMPWTMLENLERSVRHGWQMMNASRSPLRSNLKNCRSKYESIMIALTLRVRGFSEKLSKGFRTIHSIGENELFILISAPQDCLPLPPRESALRVDEELTRSAQFPHFSVLTLSSPSIYDSLPFSHWPKF